jgi:hypothetical protein
VQSEFIRVLFAANGYVIASILTNPKLKNWMGFNFFAIATVDLVLGWLIKDMWSLSFLELNEPNANHTLDNVGCIKHGPTTSLMLLTSMTSFLAVSAWSTTKLLKTISNRNGAMMIALQFLAG